MAKRIFIDNGTGVFRHAVTGLTIEEAYGGLRSISAKLRKGDTTLTRLDQRLLSDSVDTVFDFHQELKPQDSGVNEYLEECSAALAKPIGLRADEINTLLTLRASQVKTTFPYKFGKSRVR